MPKKPGVAGIVLGIVIAVVGIIAGSVVMTVGALNTVVSGAADVLNSPDFFTDASTDVVNAADFPADSSDNYLDVTAGTTMAFWFPSGMSATCAVADPGQNIVTLDQPASSTIVGDWQIVLTFEPTSTGSYDVACRADGDNFNYRVAAALLTKVDLTAGTTQGFWFPTGASATCNVIDPAGNTITPAKPGYTSTANDLAVAYTFDVATTGTYQVSCQSDGDSFSYKVGAPLMSKGVATSLVIGGVVMVVMIIVGLIVLISAIRRRSRWTRDHERAVMYEAQALYPSQAQYPAQPQGLPGSAAPAGAISAAAGLCATGLPTAAVPAAVGKIPTTQRPGASASGRCLWTPPEPGQREQRSQRQ